jgi:hypothetical protein
MRRRNALKMLSGLALAPVFSGVDAVFAGNVHAGPLDLGINLAGLPYWTTEQPFSNLATAASRWRLQDIDAPFSWDFPLPPMSAADYPLSVPKGTFLETFLIFTPHREHLPADLVVHYDGRGGLEYIGAEVVSRGPGRDDIRDLRDGGAIAARLVQTQESDPLRNLRLYPKDAVPSVGETFRPAFLQRWGSMSVLRFMDWMETNNSKIVRWEQRPLRDRFSQSEGGVALDYMIELANALEIAPWFTLPHMADDDYFREFAGQVKGILNPSLPVYVEYSNEVWNGTFEQAGYARREGLRLGLSPHEYEAQLRFYSQRTSEMLDIWETVFGNEKDRVLGVYASQAANAWSSQTILSWGKAGDHADRLAVAPYFGGSFGSPERAGSVSRWTLDDLFEELERDLDGQNKEMIQAQADVALQFGVRLVAYEGGQHLVGHLGVENNETIDGLFRSANRDPRMGALYEQHLANWKSVGGDTYVLFNSMGEYSKWGSWGLLETEASGDAYPKWAAVTKLLR